MILMCAGCGKMISVSVTGYGDENKVARMSNELFGDSFATRWETCGTCGKPYCDACSGERVGGSGNSECECGGDLSEKHNVRP
jgi:hypothetical protein